MTLRPRLSVVIVSWRVRDLLRDCLESLYDHIGLEQGSYEVIVVDNASRDGSIEMIRSDYPQVVLIENDTNLGYGRGCEPAYARARGKFIWLLNPDTLVPSNTVVTLLAIMDSEPRLGILGPRLLNGDRTFQRSSGGAYPTLWNAVWNYFFLGTFLPHAWAPAPLYLKADLQGTFDVDWVSGAAMMLRRVALGEYIPEDSFFKTADDMDLCDRARQRGWEVKYTSSCYVVHFQGRSLEQQTDLDILISAHRGGPRRFFGRHRGVLACFAYDSVVTFGHLIRWILYSILTAIKPSGRYSERSAYSRQYLVTLLRSLWRRG